MSKSKIFWYMKVIYIKRKLRTCTIQIQKEKVWFYAKKKDFFQIFNFFSKGGTLWCQNHQKKFFPFFKNFRNKPQKWLSWNHSNINRNKVMSFGCRSSYPAEKARPFMVIRAVIPPPSPPWIGLNLKSLNLLNKNWTFIFDQLHFFIYFVKPTWSTNIMKKWLKTIFWDFVCYM